MKRFKVTITLMTLLTLAVSCAKAPKSAKVGSRLKQDSSMPHKSVHFPFDNDEVFTRDIERLDENADWMKRNRDAVVILEGHCDEHGDSIYNMELGDRRARTIKWHLVKRGVPHEKIIMVVSYGETRPADPNHNYDAWKLNRRVEFTLR